jgi:hypothetical protein
LTGEEPDGVPGRDRPATHIAARLAAEAARLCGEACGELVLAESRGLRRRAVA